MFFQNSRTASVFRTGRSSMLVKTACAVAFAAAALSLGSSSAEVSNSELVPAQAGHVTASRKADRLPVRVAPAAEDAAGYAVVRNVGVNTSVVERAPTEAERRQPSRVAAR